MAQACNTNNNSVAKTISIDSTNVFVPVVKIKLDSRQKNMIAEKVEWETLSGLFSINNNVVSPYSVTCKYSVIDDTLAFAPVSPLGNGISFEIRVFGESDTLTKRYTTPVFAAKHVTPTVSNIYPLSAKVPSNILMFHVEFETPMNEGVMAFKDIAILDEKGEAKERVWREKSNWSNDGKHLVLMVHPGRIKRGIEYMKELGVLFEEGKQYTLVVPAHLKDKYGKPLGKEYKKTFTITAADRDIPVYAQSAFVSPQKNTKNAITLNFSEAIDYGTAQLGIEVFTAEGKKVEGTVASASNDSQWSFTPTQDWEDKSYTLALNDFLGDLASNHLTRKFEVEHIDSIAKRHTLTFEFKPQ